MQQLPQFGDLLILVLQVVVLGLLVSLLLAWIRNPTVGFSHMLLEFLIGPIIGLARSILRGLGPIYSWIASVKMGLFAYAGSGGQATASWVGWDIASPLWYLLMAVTIAAADFYFSVLGFSAILGQKPSIPRLPIDLDAAAGLLFVALSVIWGFLLLDVSATPVKRPWSAYTGRAARWLKVVAVSGLCLTALAGVAFTVWRQLQLGEARPPEPWNSFLPILLWALLAVLLVVASALTGWSLVASFGGIYLVALLVIGTALYIVMALCHVVVNMVDRFHGVLVGVLDTLAWPGLSTWNWACLFGWAARMHLTPIVFTARPQVGHDMGQVIFP